MRNILIEFVRVWNGLRMKLARNFGATLQQRKRKLTGLQRRGHKAPQRITLTRTVKICYKATSKGFGSQARQRDTQNTRREEACMCCNGYHLLSINRATVI